MRELLEYLGSRSQLAAWADVDRTLETGTSAFERVHGETVWDWLRRHPDEAHTFAQAIARLTEIDAAAIARGYRFEEVERICDVAGGPGALLAEILHLHGRARGVLLDAPHVLAEAAAYLARRGVADRVTCVAGDFFEAVPPGCDAYLLKDVLHDWDDAAALRILETCRRAAPAGARLLVAEGLVDTRSTRAPGPFVDVQMMLVCHGGRQRSADEHGALMARAGFRPRRVIALPGVTSLVGGVAS